MKHTLVALMEDKPGVLNRVSGLFRRRNYNIESLSVGHSETAGISRMTIVVHGDDRIVDQVARQLEKLVNVTRVQNVSSQPTVVRELALIKVNATVESRSGIIQLVDIFGAEVLDVSLTTLTIELTGTEDQIESFVNLLRPFGIKELARTGQVAMLRGSNTK